MEPIFSTTFDIVTILLTTLMCVRNFKKLTENSRFFIYYIFVFFYVIPLFIDYLYAFPTYTYSYRFRGFYIANNDPLTRIVYDFFVLLVQWLLLRVKTKEERPILISEHDNHTATIGRLLYIGLVFPTVATLLFGSDKSILYTFMWRENDLVAEGYVPLAEELSYIGICCAVLLFFKDSSKHRLARRILSILFAYVNVCIEGKRSILFFLFLVIFVVNLPGIRDKSIPVKQRRNRVFALLLLLVIIIAAMVVMTVNVKMNVRQYTDPSAVYTTIRIDFFRDDRVRMAIYSILYPDKLTILKYPGETLIPAVLNIFPLDYIAGFLKIHPLSYTAYISAALTGSSVISQEKAFMTPAIFAELLSNFHILGLAFMVMITLWFARKAEKYPYPVNVFILVSYILIQMYSIPYVAYFLEATLILCLSYHVKFVFGNKLRD